jgi:hypothetical protein
MLCFNLTYKNSDFPPILSMRQEIRADFPFRAKNTGRLSQVACNFKPINIS